MTVLGIDPSLSSTGYAVIENRKIIASGKIQTNPSNGDTDTRIQLIIKELIITAGLHNIDAVMMEDGFSGVNIGGSLKLAELRGAIIFYFKYNGIKIVHKQPKEIRKILGLKGNAKKEEVALALQNMYPNLKNEVGEYSDKANKNKTSDIYDAISIGLSYFNEI